VLESQHRGRAGALVMLGVAQRCPSDIMDSTRFDYTKPLVTTLPDRVGEFLGLIPMLIGDDHTHVHDHNRSACFRRMPNTWVSSPSDRPISSKNLVNGLTEPGERASRRVGLGQ